MNKKMMLESNINFSLTILRDILLKNYSNSSEKLKELSNTYDSLGKQLNYYEEYLKEELNENETN